MCRGGSRLKVDQQLHTFLELSPILSLNLIMFLSHRVMQCKTNCSNNAERSEKEFFPLTSDIPVSTAMCSYVRTGYDYGISIDYSCAVYLAFHRM